MKALGWLTVMLLCMPTAVWADEATIKPESDTIAVVESVIAATTEVKADNQSSMDAKEEQAEAGAADGAEENTLTKEAAQEAPVTKLEEKQENPQAENALKEPSEQIDVDGITIKKREISFIAINPCKAEAVAAFKEANEYFVKGKLSTDAQDKSIQYGEAIRCVNDALQYEPDNCDLALLASQIYRSKGGIAYAKSYFQRAERILGENLKAHPDGIDINLDYALALVAGDSRYLANYSEYVDKGKLAAEKVLELCELWYKEHDKTAKSLRAGAMANLLLGNKEKCGELLLEADGLAGEESTLTKVYTEYVAQGKWLWQVSPEAVDKEFMLYFMKDAERYK